MSALKHADELPPLPRPQSSGTASGAALSTAAAPKRSKAMFDQPRQFVPWCVMLRSWTALALWRACWNRDQRNGKPFHATMAALAHQMGVDERRTKRAMRMLLRHGLVEQVSRGSGYARKANEYRIPNALPKPPLKGSW